MGNACMQLLLFYSVKIVIYSGLKKLICLQVNYHIED